MTKKYIVISTCLFMLVVSGLVGKFIFEKKQANNTTIVETSNQNQIQEGEGDEENNLTAEEIQAELDAIITDDSIDISDWPTFTNTKYGWSIKYHPSGYWTSNSMMNIPEEAPAPSYYYRNSDYKELSVLKVWFIDQEEYKKNSESIRSSYDCRLDDKEIIDVNLSDLNFRVNWKNKVFCFESASAKIISFNVNENLSQSSLKQIIKSISSFQFN